MGLSLRDWEEMTPVEFNRYARGYSQRREEEQTQTQHNIYALANLLPAMLSKHPPSYDQVWPARKENVEQTDEALYAVVRGLNALFGGEEV